MRKTVLNLAFSMAAAGILFGILGIWIPFVYDMNDDLYMRAFVSGAYTGTPDAHMIFMGYLLGIVLKGLYTLRRNIDWYGLWLIGCHLFCLGILIFRVIQHTSENNKKIFRTGIVILCFLSLWISRAVMLTFTTAAACVCATTIFWYGTMEEDNASIVEWLILALLAFMGYCTRKNIALLMIPLAGMIFWFKNRRQMRWKKIRSWKPVILVLTIFVLLYITDYFAYSSSQWKEYTRFNTLRSELFDYYGFPDYEENQDFYNEIGIDENVETAIEQYSLILDENINSDTLTKIRDKAKEIKDNRPFSEKIGQTIDIVVENWFSLEYFPLNYVAIILALWLFYRCMKIKDKTALLWYSIIIVTMILIWSYLAYQGRFPARIGYSLHILDLMTELVFLWYLKEEKWSYKRGMVYTITGVFIVGAAFGVLKTKSYAESSHKKNESYRAVLDYCEARNTNFYFMDVFSFSFYTDNYEFFLPSNEKNYMRFGDWMAYSPLYYEKLSHNQIENVAEALAEKENLYFIARDNADLQYLKRYMKSLNPDYTYEVVDSIQSDGFIFLVYKWKTADVDRKELENSVIETLNCTQNEKDANLMLDGDINTGWGCEAQEQGVEVQINLKKEQVISGVRLDITDLADTPKELGIFLSKDGIEWEMVETENVSGISFYFKPVSARYMKLSLGEGDNQQWKWRIQELTLIGAENTNGEDESQS